MARVLARRAEADAKAMRRLASDPDIDDASVGFHAQQAIEKWLKAVMALRGLTYEKKHDLGRLLELLARASVELPPGSDSIDRLTGYAVESRYGDLLDPGTLERDSVIDLVDRVGEWATQQLEASQDES